MINKIKNNYLIIGLTLFTIGIFIVTARINVFRYNNFDFGKFDLGNMTQMIWYTMQGKPLYLTDYFGTNLPRWAMSHVDPILLLFVPIFAIFQHPLILVFSQITLVLASTFLVYKIVLLKLNSKLAATFFGFSFLFYPAVGFLNAWTGFHGVTAVIFFFFAAFYTYELMFTKNNFSKKKLSLFWLFLILTMSGKEQIPLYIVTYGVFIFIFRFTEQIELPSKKEEIKFWIKNLWQYQNVRIGTSMILVGSLWFYLAFFVVIPKYAHLRSDGFNEFAKSIGINTNVVHDVQNENYFLRRYEAFGSSYTDVVLGMLSDPKQLVNISFGGDKPDNLKQTLAPLAYTSLLYPPLFVLAFPDFLINYATSSSGIGTSEIINHRISMIIPILFIASIYSVNWLALLFTKLIRYKNQNKTNEAKVFSLIAILLSGIILFTNVKTSFDYQNPVYMWLTQAIRKRIQIPNVFAKTNEDIAKEDLQLGARFKLSKLETKDRECAQRIVDMIPKKATVSGPDYLGAHLSMRETYAIFPAMFDTADFVIVDVFAQKILRILELDVTLVRDVVADVIKSQDYTLRLGCGNLFVFERIGVHNKSKLLPLQEKFNYQEKTDLEIFQSLTVVDYTLPKKASLGDVLPANFVYTKRENSNLDGYVLFLTLINEKTGEIYQAANLPSFALNQLRNWRSDRYYIENIEISFPEFLDLGNYKVFIGMSNEVRTRSIYLGNIMVNQ